MQGLMLRLVDETNNTFWHCFQPLRSELNRYWWYLEAQPWMGAPAGFPEDQEQEGLWPPGLVGKWAEYFCEEDIILWAIPLSENPQTHTHGARTQKNPEEFLQSQAEIVLIYTDSTSWELFARKVFILDRVRKQLIGSRKIRIYETSLENREAAFRRAGLQLR